MVLFGFFIRWKLLLYINFSLRVGKYSEFFSSSLKFIFILSILIPLLNPFIWLGISITICWSPILGSISGSFKVGSRLILILFFWRSIILLKSGSSIPFKFLYPKLFFILVLICVSIFVDWIPGILKS